MAGVIDLLSSDEDETNEVPATSTTKLNEKQNPLPTVVTSTAIQPNEIETEAIEKAATHEKLEKSTEVRIKESLTQEPNFVVDPVPNLTQEISCGKQPDDVPMCVDVLKTLPTTAPSQEQRLHRRKSQHQTLRTSPEMEFESLSTLNKNANEIKRNILKSNLLLQKQKSKRISILASKPLSSEQLLDTEFDKFLREDLTLNLIRELAAERVRINQILSLNSMPEIKFSLYTKREMIEFQLKERFRQKEIRIKSFKLKEDDAAT